MLVTIQITAGADTGPLFNLSSDADSPPFSGFESGVPKASLVAGYTTTVPSGATIVRVTSTGFCTNFTNLPIGSTTTTTTTTALPYSVFVVGFDVSVSPGPSGWSSNTLACGGSGTPLTLYANPASTTFQDLITNGHALYTNSSLTTPFNGQGLWYQTVTPAGNNVVRIDTNGFIDTAIYNCP